MLQEKIKEALFAQERMLTKLLKEYSTLNDKYVCTWEGTHLTVAYEDYGKGPKPQVKASFPAQVFGMTSATTICANFVNGSGTKPVAIPASDFYRNRLLHIKKLIKENH